MSVTDFEPDPHEGESCTVAAIGRTLGTLWARLDELDDLKGEEERKARGNREKPGNGMPVHPERAWLHAEGRADALRFALSSHRARSLAGCLCQLAQASSLADDLWDEIENPDWQLRRTKHALDRLLYSVVMHLEEAAGITTEAVGMGPLMPNYMNPWQRPEATMAKLRAA